MGSSQLTDRFNRNLNYLRVSITDRCNLNCIYCFPHGRIPRLSHDEILKYEEILRIVQIGVDLGITKVRVTGGEPLVRKGVYDFLNRISQMPGVSEVTLTTNGILLKDNLDNIRRAGIKRINISLDTLDKDKFKKITGNDGFETVWSGIETASSNGFDPVKLNVVALRGTNDDELLDFAQLTIDRPFHVRFIEYMPIGKSRMQFGPPLLVPEIMQRVSTIGSLHKIAKNTNDGPAERFRFEDAKGEIGFISALSHHFCDSCNRLRLTASGKLRPCLLSEHELDMKSVLREGGSDEDLAEIFLDAVRNKPSDHNLAMEDPSGISCQMSSIGG